MELVVLFRRKCRIEEKVILLHWVLALMKFCLKLVLLFRESIVSNYDRRVVENRRYSENEYFNKFAPYVAMFH